MLVTRATRHDKADLRRLLDVHGWTDVDLDEGVAFIARDGDVIACVRLVEIEPQVVAVDDVLVRQDRRGEGIGRRLMAAAMSARGGTLYLVCHAERLAFYGHLGFRQVPFEQLPSSFVRYMEKVGDHPSPPGHEHFYLTAR